MAVADDKRLPNGGLRRFLRQYGVRLAAALVLAAAGVIVGIAVPAHRFWWLLLLGPLAVGASALLLSWSASSERINGWGASLAAGAERARNRAGNFARYVQRPFFGGAHGFWRVSEPIKNVHLKAGVRLAALAYIVTAMALALYVALLVILALVALFLLLMVILWFTSNKEEESPSAPIGESTRGSDFIPPIKGAYYRGTNWFNEEMAGRVDADGNIYRGTNWVDEEKIGRVDATGNIYKGTNVLTEEKVGRLDADGRLHKGSNWFNEERVGRIDKSGDVLKGTGVFNEEKVGRVEKS